MWRQNEWQLNDLPLLTFVDHFDFITPLTLEQCSQKLLKVTKSNPQRGKTHVYEVSQEHKAELFFAAKVALNQSAWYLAGNITSANTQSRVSCYTGIPIATLVIPFIFLVVLLILVGIANRLSVIAVVLLFVTILIITGLVGIRYVRQFRRTLEQDIRQLLS